MAEEVERVRVTREVGSSDRSGPYTIIGIILGVLIVAGVALAVIGLPQIEAWWGDSSPSTSTVVETPAN